MKSANNELTTARNTPNPIVAAGKDDAPVPGKSSIAPTSSQGLAVNLCCDSHHATMARGPLIVGGTISVVFLGVFFPRRRVPPLVVFAPKIPPGRLAPCNRNPSDSPLLPPPPGGHPRGGFGVFPPRGGGQTPKPPP